MLFWQFNEKLKEWKVLNAKVAKTRDELAMRMLLRASKLHWEGGAWKPNSVTATELRPRGLVRAKVTTSVHKEASAHCGSRSETVHSSLTWQPDPFPVCYKSTHQENSCNFSSLPQKYQLTYLCPVCTQKMAVLSLFPQAHRLESSVWEELHFLHFWGISKYLRTQKELLACRLCEKIKTNLLCISQDIFTSK